MWHRRQWCPCGRRGQAPFVVASHARVRDEPGPRGRVRRSGWRRCGEACGRSRGAGRVPERAATAAGQVDEAVGVRERQPDAGQFSVVHLPPAPVIPLVSEGLHGLCRERRHQVGRRDVAIGDDGHRRGRRQVGRRDIAIGDDGHRRGYRQLGHRVVGDRGRRGRCAGGPGGSLDVRSLGVGGETPRRRSLRRRRPAPPQQQQGRHAGGRHEQAGAGRAPRTISGLARCVSGPPGRTIHQHAGRLPAGGQAHTPDGARSGRPAPGPRAPGPRRRGDSGQSGSGTSPPTS